MKGLEKNATTLSSEITWSVILQFFHSEGPVESLYPGGGVNKDSGSRLSEKPAFILLRKGNR